jgi:hypothetical protein
VDTRGTILIVVIFLVILFIATRPRSRRDHDSTAGHYDPNAIGQYIYNPATQTYRLELPTLPRAGAPATPGDGPPHRRRRRRRRPDTEGG